MGGKHLPQPRTFLLWHHAATFIAAPRESLLVPIVCRRHFGTWATTFGVPLDPHFHALAAVGFHPLENIPFSKESLQGILSLAQTGAGGTAANGLSPTPTTVAILSLPRRKHQHVSLAPADQGGGYVGLRTPGPRGCHARPPTHMGTCLRGHCTETVAPPPNQRPPPPLRRLASIFGWIGIIGIKCATSWRCALRHHNKHLRRGKSGAGSDCLTLTSHSSNKLSGARSRWEWECGWRRSSPTTQHALLMAPKKQLTTPLHTAVICSRPITWPCNARAR